MEDRSELEATALEADDRSTSEAIQLRDCNPHRPTGGEHGFDEVRQAGTDDPDIGPPYRALLEKERKPGAQHHDRRGHGKRDRSPVLPTLMKLAEPAGNREA